MAREYRFKCPLANGLHARPASALAEAASRYESHITLVNERTGAIANARSVLELVAAGVMHDEECRLEFSGTDAEEACAALSAFIEKKLPSHDTPLPAAAARGTGRIPRALVDSAENIVTGIPASPGIGRGLLVKAGGLRLPDAVMAAEAEDVSYEMKVVDEAFRAVINDLQEGHAETDKTAAEIRKAMLALASDPALRRLVDEQIEEGGATAARAVVASVEQFSDQLRQSGSEYLRARVADLQDIGLMLLSRLPGGVSGSEDMALSDPSIVAAQSLGPSQMLGFDRTLLKGLVLGDAGTTSHVVILARSFGIPCVCGATPDSLGEAGAEALIDGTHGFVATPITEPIERHFSLEQKIIGRISAQSSALKDVEAATKDGRRVEIAANISTAEEAAAVLETGAEGVGLFRTEMLFSAAESEPSEDEQYEVYAAAAQAMQGRPVIIRTLDVGGDKPLNYLDLPSESNPFLGYRGIRIYQQHSELFERQLRAIIRASAQGNVWIMAPMVAGLDEARWFREQVTTQQDALAGEGVSFNEEMPLGIMVEVPSAALVVDQLCDVVDFLSVGTNDLTQYLLAVERGNPAVAELYDELHPALIRMLAQIVEMAHKNGKWVGLCGELARNPRYTPLLVGLGFDELSMSAPAVPQVKAAVAECSYEVCRELAKRALECRDAASIRVELDNQASGGKKRPLLEPGLIDLQAESTSKVEAIRELCVLNYLTGRCRDLDDLEDAIWAREEAYSTGLGNGFAIPHCKAATVTAGSLAVLKLSRPIEWGSLDDAPVDVVLMLTMPESDEDNRHLQVFATLARKLMHEEFRDGLRAASDADGIITFLGRELGLAELEG